jgi:CRISPR system Cascade subunit CasD
MDSIKSSGSKGDTVLSDRYYMADADYLVGLEGDRSLLEALDAALASPCWQLYFGRKSFIPSCQIGIGIVDSKLVTALQQHPSLSKKPKHPTELRYVLEVENSLDTRRDVPLNWQKRLFGSRCVETKYLEVAACISLN